MKTLSIFTKTIILTLLLLFFSSLVFTQSDNRYDSGLNLPFNEKAGDVNPQTGNITIKNTDVKLPGRAGMDFSFTRIWSLNQSNVYNMYYYNDSDRLNSVTVEQFNNIGTGWSTNIPFIQDDMSSGELIKNLFFGGSVYEIDQTGIGVVNLNNANLLGYDLLDKRIYRSTDLSYADFNLYDLGELVTCNVDDTEGELSGYVLLLKNNSKYWFRADGKLMMHEDSMKDENGKGLNEIWYFYDELDRLCLVVDTVGRKIRFSYDTNGNLSYIEWDVTRGEKDPETGIRNEVPGQIRRVTYTYESGENYAKILELSNNTLDYKESFVLKTITDPYGNVTLLDYEEGPVMFSYNSSEQHTENVYLLLTAISSVYTEADGNYLNRRNFSYGEPGEDLYTKYFYTGYMESYRIRRQYYEDRNTDDRDSRIMYDTRYIYHDNGEAGNYKQYTAVIETGNITSTYVYSISGAANKDNVLDKLLVKTGDGFLQSTDYTYNTDRIKILETVERDGSFVYEEQFQFDRQGNLRRHEDRLGLVTFIEYDEVYSIPTRIVKTFNTEGVEYSYESENAVNNYGQVEREILYLSGRAVDVATYTYDSYGNVTSVTDADGVTVHTEYDDVTNTFPVMTWQNVNIASWPDGDVHENWLTDPESTEEVIIRSWKIFNSDGSVWIEIDNEGYAIEHYYDDNGAEIEIVNPDEDDITVFAEPGAEYFKDFRDNSYYDAFLASRIGNPGARMEIDYQKEFIKTFADMDKNAGYSKITGIQKDGLGNVEKEIEYGESETEYSVKRMSYDSLGRMIALTDPDAGSSSIPMNVDGTFVDRYDKTWVVWYDDLGRKEQVLYPTTESGKMHYKYITYDDFQNSTTTVDPEGRKIYERRDWNDNVVEVIAYGDSNVSQTYTYTYDALNRKISFKDPMGIITRYEYDERDLLLVQDYGDETGRDTFSYNDLGQLEAKTDRNGNLLEFTYDELGRNTSVLHYKEDLFEYSVDTEYDNRGNAVRISNGNLIEHYRYDSNNRVYLLERYLKDISIREDVAGVWGGTEADQVFTFTYEYNDANMVTRMTYPDGSLHEFDYDDTLGRLENIWEAPGGSLLQAFVTDLDYNRSGVVTRMDYANGTCQEWEFDNRKRISNIVISKSSGEVIEELDYTLNGVGDILSINENEYEYDGFNRIIGAKTMIPGNTDLVKLVEAHYGTFLNEESENGLEYNAAVDFNSDERINGFDHLYANTHSGDEVYDVESFTYDKNGNRIKLVQNGDEYTYRYGERNRLEEIWVKKDGKDTSTIFAEYEYDENGNTVRRIIHSDEGELEIEFEYDSLNRLIRTKEDGEVTEYFYDNAGNRFIKRSPDGSLTLYLRHGQIAVAMDIEVNADQSEDMGEINRYVLSGDLVAGRVTTTVHADDSTTDVRSWYHLDHLNSTKCVTDEDEEVEVAYVYRAFGEQLKKLGEGDAKYTYGGKELDDNTNLYYFNARYYDATTGRFINVDPIQDGSNWYVYCNNNPLNMADPTGLDDGEIDPDEPEEEVEEEVDQGNEKESSSGTDRDSEYGMIYQLGVNLTGGGSTGGAVEGGIIVGVTEDKIEIGLYGQYSFGSYMGCNASANVVYSRTVGSGNPHDVSEWSTSYGGSGSMPAGVGVGAEMTTQDNGLCTQTYSGGIGAGATPGEGHVFRNYTVVSPTITIDTGVVDSILDTIEYFVPVIREWR